MDLLLSLPVASYFWSTSLTSWSTSLNLLFFYMTWSTLVLSHSPVKIEIVGTTAIRLGLWLLPSIAFLLFDTLLPSLSEAVKYSRRQSLPPRDAKAISKLIGLALFNLGLETALEGFLSYSLAFLIGSPVFRTTTTLPLPWQMIKHIGILFAGREVIGYYIHRFLLHSSRLSTPTITTTKSTRRSSILPRKFSVSSSGRKSKTTHNKLASWHSAYSHSSTSSPASSSSSPPFSLQIGTDHPFTFLLHRFLPIYLPSLLTSLLPLTLSSNLHLLTYFLFVGLTTLEDTFSHSGYSFIPGLIMGGITRRTSMHYESGGKGNYASWGVMDWLCGTSLVKGRGVVDDFRDEVGLRGKLDGVEEERGLIEGVWEGVTSKGKRGRKNRGGAKNAGESLRSRSSRRRKVSEGEREWRD
ncbi:hypothetical protein QBC43DRAFT_306781 [Cladorrhinum sp. PSN259]|nr:hypothetical protein QBC43DRAFT_306781 [Cladorrhinum sp. PSN259]